MAECRCGTCEHCVADSGARAGHSATDELTSHAPPTPRNDKPRRLLTRTEIEALRTLSPNGLTPASATFLLDAYETAVRLLEEVVRECNDGTDATPPVCASDIAWLALRETER